MGKNKIWKGYIHSILIFLIVVNGIGCQNNKDIKLENLKTYTVTKGMVFKGVEAHGEVAAENEVLLLCPYTSKIERILRLPGSNVKKGEVILSLDASGIEEQIETLNDQLEMLNNNLLKLTLSSQSVKIDMEHDVEVKKLRIVSLESELADLKALIEVGGTSKANIEKTEQELVLAKKELNRATKKHRIRLEQLEADEAGLNLEIEMKEKQLDQALHTKDEMIITAPGKGVVLDVNARKGEIVNKNHVLVRISEHTRLKIKAEISDKYHNEIRNGGRVFALLDSTRLEGTIGNIKPVIEDDKIQFEVFLKNPQNDDIRVNKKVSLLVVTEERNNVLRLKNSLPQVYAKKDFCYTLHAGQVLQKNIRTGLIGHDYIEVVEGLDSGEVVIVSDIPSLKQKKNNR
jgi:HlyD family secretion protein